VTGCRLAPTDDHRGVGEVALIVVSINCVYLMEQTVCFLLGSALPWVDCID